MTEDTGENGGIIDPGGYETAPILPSREQALEKSVSSNTTFGWGFILGDKTCTIPRSVFLRSRSA